MRNARLLLFLRRSHMSYTCSLYVLCCTTHSHGYRGLVVQEIDSLFSRTIYLYQMTEESLISVSEMIVRTSNESTVIDLAQHLRHRKKHYSGQCISWSNRFLSETSAIVSHHLSAFICSRRFHSYSTFHWMKCLWTLYAPFRFIERRTMLNWMNRLISIALNVFYNGRWKLEYD